MRQISLLIFILSTLSSCSCKAQVEPIQYPTTDLTTADLIPMPERIEPSRSGFGLMSSTSIELKVSDVKWGKIANHLAAQVLAQTGIDLNRPADKKHKSTIVLERKNIANKNPEAYELIIENDKLQILARTEQGAFRAVQTVLQLIPAETQNSLTDQPVWVIPTGTIVDAPNLEYRSMMLDVARHFFTVEEVKKLIDLLAYYKYNTLHLHLSDDQGWRIEIKSWPKLATVGGATEVGGTQGGYFTQEDFKDIVAYAADRYMQIVPEIDMPGHTNAASLSYPQLNGNGKKVERYTKMRVGFSTFNTRSQVVYDFIDDVVREISAISPSPYFHIGGDESDATATGDYIYFVNKVQGIVAKYGKQMIGWDEIAQSSLRSGTVAQYWRHDNYAKMAAGKGCKVVMSPAKKAYLDMKYNNSSKHGLKWAGLIPLSTAYNWNPSTYLSGLPKSAILGLEAPLWSETITEGSEMEYLAFPRAIAYAELGWSVDAKRSWQSFKQRLGAQGPYLQRLNVNYYRSPDIKWKSASQTNLKGLYQNN